MRAFKRLPGSHDDRSMGPASPRVFGRRRILTALGGSTLLAAFIGLLALAQRAPADPSRVALENRAADLAQACLDHLERQAAIDHQQRGAELDQGRVAAAAAAERSHGGHTEAYSEQHRQQPNPQLPSQPRGRCETP